MSLSGKGSQPKSGLQCYDFTYTWGWIGFVQGDNATTKDHLKTAM